MAHPQKEPLRALSEQEEREFKRSNANTLRILSLSGTNRTHQRQKIARLEDELSS